MSARASSSSASPRARPSRTASTSTSAPATGLVGEARLAALESECVRLEALGATRGTLLLADEENESCQNMQDVEGNEFCLD